MVWFMLFNATFNNISINELVLLVKEMATLIDLMKTMYILNTKYV